MIDPATDRVLITGAAGAIGTALRNGLRAQWRHLRLTDARPITDPTPQRGMHRRRHRRPRRDRAHDARCRRRRAPRRRRRRLHAGGPVPRQRARHVRRVRGGAAGRRAAHRVRLQQPRVRLLSDRRSASRRPCRLGRTACTARSRPGARPCCAATSTATASARCRCASAPIATLPIDQRSLATWLSPGDVARLVDASLRHPDPGCLVVNGYSNNTRIKTFDPNWEFLGYRPQDNAEDHARCCAAGRRCGRAVGMAGTWRLARACAGAAAAPLKQHNKPRGNRHGPHNGVSERDRADAGRERRARGAARLRRLGHLVRPGADHGRDRQGLLQGTGPRRSNTR